ncbi:MAG TPA: FtsQ-type POTRA domain-containing protein [Iamia sp.]
MAGSRTAVREWRPPDEAPVIAHPRIRARRAEVARGVNRRRLRRVKGVLAVICAVVWGLVAVRSPLFDVDRVQVVGAERVSADEVRRAASTTAAGTPMIEVDLARARGGVGALPWIDEVRVTRLWPGTIRVVVTERHEVAAVDHAGGWALVDADGRVLEVVEAEPDLPTLPGVSDRAPGRTLGADDRRALAVLGALPSALRDATDATAEGPDGLELVLDDGFRVVLGDGADLAAKAEAADAVRQHAGTPDGGCRIDVRVPTAPVLTTGRGCA